MELVNVVNGHNFWIGLPILFIIMGIGITIAVVIWVMKFKLKDKDNQDLAIQSLIIAITLIASALVLFKNYETFPIYYVKINDDVSYNAVTDWYEILGEENGIWKLRLYSDTNIENTNLELEEEG